MWKADPPLSKRMHPPSGWVGGKARVSGNAETVWHESGARPNLCEREHQVHTAARDATPVSAEDVMKRTCSGVRVGVAEIA